MWELSIYYYSKTNRHMYLCTNNWGVIGIDVDKADAHSAATTLERS